MNKQKKQKNLKTNEYTSKLHPYVLLNTQQTTNIQAVTMTAILITLCINLAHLCIVNTHGKL